LASAAIARITRPQNRIIDIQPKPIPHQLPMSPIMLYLQAPFSPHEARAEAILENATMSSYFAVAWFDTLSMAINGAAQKINVRLTNISMLSLSR